MAENRHTQTEQHGSHGVGHERSDVNVLVLTRFGIGLLLGIIASLFIVWFVFDYFLSREAARVPRPTHRLDVNASRLPPEPRLQVAPSEDLAEMRAAEDRILNTYAWLDRSRGELRIPIERAMQLVAREGLPSRQTPGPITADHATVPSLSGLGPIMTQVGGPLSPNRTFPPDQPLEIKGTGNFRDGRQAGGPPTPPDRSLFREPPQ